MLKLKPGGVGAVQNKKRAVIQTTSIMIAEPNTHTNLESGAGQNNKHVVIQTTSFMITEPNTNIHTHRLPMTIKHHEHKYLYIYIFNQGSCTYDTNIMSPRVIKS